MQDHAGFDDLNNVVFEKVSNWNSEHVELALQDSKCSFHILSASFLDSCKKLVLLTCGFRNGGNKIRVLWIDTIHQDVRIVEFLSANSKGMFEFSHKNLVYQIRFL